MAKCLNEARRSLERAKETAKKRLLELDIERRDIKVSLKSLDTALKALARSDQKQPSNPSHADAQDTSDRQVSEDE